MPASMSKPAPTDLPIHAFANAQDFEEFLETEHAKILGFHLKFARKASGIPSIKPAEAVEVALCFGWIDGQSNGLDESHWLIRYTPRRPKSIWSRKNVDTVARLLNDGKIRPAGLATIEAAKADGRWDRAYAGPATMTAPADFELALDGKASGKNGGKSPTPARVFWDKLGRSERYKFLWKIETATLDKARKDRITDAVKKLAEGLKMGDTVATRVTIKPKASQKDVPTKKKTSVSVKKAVTKKAASKPKVSTSVVSPDAAKPPIDESVDIQPRRAGLRARR